MTDTSVSIDSSTPSLASLHISGQENQNDSNWSLSANSSTISIGRSFTNDVILPFSWISRRHGMLQVDKDQHYSIIDLGSANGTFVNRQMIHAPTRLHSGDIITMGSTTLIFQQTELPTPSVDDTESFDDQTAIFLQKEIVSVLVCDIRNYTSLSETIGDKRISDLLQLWSRVVSKAVDDNNGRVDKFIGDAVMAVWSDGDGYGQATSALRAAAEIQYLTQALGKRFKEIDTPLCTWVALNTGKAILGNMGVNNNRDYTIIGDVVNLAFRFEELAPQINCDVVIGESSYRHLADGDQFFKPHTVTVRGKSERLHCYGCKFAGLYAFLSAESEKKRAVS